MIRGKSLLLHGGEKTVAFLFFEQAAAVKAAAPLKAKCQDGEGDRIWRGMKKKSAKS
jgi:hypothetical protein